MPGRRQDTPGKADEAGTAETAARARPGTAGADLTHSLALASALTPGGIRTPATALQLQRLVGNRATLGLGLGAAPGTPLRPARGGGVAVTPTTAAVIQRKNGKGKKRKGRRRGGRGGQTRTQVPTSSSTAPVTTPSTPQPTSMLGGIWDYFTSTPKVGSDNEGDSTLAGEEVEGELSGETTTEEPPSFFKIPKVVIDLGTKEIEGALGKLKGSGRAAGGLEGFEAKGKLEYEYGSGEDKEIADVAYQVLGGELNAKGTISNFIGTKAKLELEGQFNSKAWAGKGKLGAFSGMEQKIGTEVVIKSGATELAKFKGAMGWTMGVGGELAATFSWPSGGSWKVATKGKFAIGVGGSWEYELELPISTFASTLWSWVKSWGSSWATWIYDGLIEGSG
jgi:hypothetical protein